MYSKKQIQKDIYRIENRLYKIECILNTFTSSGDQVYYGLQDVTKQHGEIIQQLAALHGKEITDSTPAKYGKILTDSLT